MSMRRLVVLVGFLLLASAGPLPAQEPSYVGELRFVRDLRAKGYADLAGEYLDRLEAQLKSAPSPELARELPLERAITLMVSAADVPDSTRRMDVYQRARVAFEAFVSVTTIVFLECWFFSPSGGTERSKMVLPHIR